MRVTTFLAVAGFAVCLASVASAQERETDTPRDLVKLGQSLLPSDDVPHREAGAPKHVDGAATPLVEAADAGAEDAGREDAGEDAGREDAAAEDPPALAATKPDDELADAVPTGASLEDDAGGVAPDIIALGPAPVGIGPSARRARIASGKNAEQKGIEESPLAKLGLPDQAVPVVATTAAIGAAAIWPFVVKTLTGLLKKFLAALIKVRAKKGKTIDKDQKKIRVLGLLVRPAELGALLLGALIYGFAVCYSFQGRSLTASFLFGQEMLAAILYYSRSFVRFGFERRYNLPTQFRLWMAGGVLCLVSTYLGTTLGTVGYELEEAKSKEDANRVVRMKALLTTLALVMALVFFAANVFYPMKILQSGRVMLSGIALAEILPITPMPGKKIFGWNKAVWALLAIAIVPTFVLINYFL